MTTFLSPDEVVALHDEMIEKYGGATGIRDNGLLEGAVYRCQASFGGQGLYKNIFEKAAALFHSIIFDHPFVDGNKRTALVSAASFLLRNKYLFDAPDEDLLAFPLWAEKEQPGVDVIAKWLKRHCRNTGR